MGRRHRSPVDCFSFNTLPARQIRALSCLSARLSLARCQSALAPILNLQDRSRSKYTGQACSKHYQIENARACTA
jgi:hypothetical protein